MGYRRNKYQYKFSEMHREEMYNRLGRERNAKTMVSVLQDYFNSDLKSLTLLDVGSSTGLIANYLAMYFGEVVGIDISEHQRRACAGTAWRFSWSSLTTCLASCAGSPQYGQPVSP